jgi:hypothetical protein
LGGKIVIQPARARAVGRPMACLFRNRQVSFMPNHEPLQVAVEKTRENGRLPAVRRGDLVREVAASAAPEGSLCARCVPCSGDRR